MTVSAMPHEPRDPTVDPEFAEELAHGFLRTLGVTDVSTYWVATLAARATVWRHFAGDRHAVGMLRLVSRELQRRVLVHRLAGPLVSDERGDLEWRLSQLDHAHLHPDDLVPPAGWTVTL